ncbi:MAG: GTP cyclohydrolase I FolE [Candidatus Methanospirareceae archaeon]
MRIGWKQFFDEVSRLARRNYLPEAVYGVPTGGSFVSLALSGLWGCPCLDELEHTRGVLVVDDLVDSGKTLRPYLRAGATVDALFRKTHSPDDLAPDATQLGEEWVQFPWEQDSSPKDAVTRLIEYIGDDPNREGLIETPDRVVRSYAELFSGYQQEPSELMKVFHDDSCDEMVVVKDIEFFSTCEHHMLPFFGRGHIAYIPNGKVLGVSKLVRLLDVYARRLQIQERICQQVTEALDKCLSPKGSACVLEAVHLCMSARGVGKQHSKLVTSSLTGEFRNNKVRNEFLSLVGLG